MLLFAEAVEKSPFEQILDSGAMKYMIDGGIFMWPILVMGIIAVGVVIERFRALRMLTTNSDALRDRILEMVRNDRPEDALELCERSRGPVAAILAVGLRCYLTLRKLECPDEQVEGQVDKAMEDSGVHIAAVLEEHLPILGTLSAVAPMVGSVGTVVGMVILFADIVEKFGTQNIVIAAASGIKVKLIVTVWGLLVGIPAYVAYNYFTVTINRYMLEVEEAGTMLGEAVTVRLATQRREARESSPENVAITAH